MRRVLLALLAVAVLAPAAQAATPTKPVYDSNGQPRPGAVRADRRARAR